jgi:uncharacterized protein
MPPRAARLRWMAEIGLLAVPGISLALTVPLMRRRAPGSQDTPADFGLPFELVQFPSRDGVRLGGWWIPVPADPRGTVILCPGQRTSMNDDLIHAVPLYRARFNVLMFDFRAHGLSDGRLVTFGALEQRDLRGALDTLGRERGVTRAGVLGFSMGAGVALLVAAQDERIGAVVVDGAFTRLDRLLSGWGTARGMPRPAAHAMAWAMILAGSARARCRMDRANPIDTASQIRAPVLFIHGDADPFVSPDEIEALAAQVAGRTKLWRVPDAEHRQIYGRHPDAYHERVLAWFEQHLS